MSETTAIVGTAGNETDPSDSIRTVIVSRFRYNQCFFIGDRVTLFTADRCIEFAMHMGLDLALDIPNVDLSDGDLGFHNVFNNEYHGCDSMAILVEIKIIGSQGGVGLRLDPESDWC